MKEPITFNYKIALSKGEEIFFNIKLDAESLEFYDESDTLPEWTKRSEFGCKNISCSLAENDTCHIARVVNKLIQSFKNIPSIEKVEVTLTTRERSFSKRCTIQSAVGSVSGILMATSGCPVLGKLKPMARFHLPFATLEETEFRVFSMYLLAQMLRGRRNLSMDYSLNDLKLLYDEIQDINLLAARKIQELEKSDATINGLVILYSFAQLVTFNLELNDLSNLENLYKDWLR